MKFKQSDRVGPAHDCLKQRRSSVLHASVASPNRRCLGRQQTVRRLGHSCANSVEPFLTRGFAQNSLLVIVDFARAYATRINRLGRRRSAPSVHTFIIGQSAVTAGVCGPRRLLQGFVVGVKDAVEFLRSALRPSLVFFTVHGFARVLFGCWRAGLSEVILVLREIWAHIPGWTENRTPWTSSLVQIVNTLSWTWSEVHNVIAAAAKRLPVIWVFAVIKPR